MLRDKPAGTLAHRFAVECASDLKALPVRRRRPGSRLVILLDLSRHLGGCLLRCH
jgi:hypothetical protein